MSQPDFTKKIVSTTDWDSWSKEQQDFIINHHGKKISNEDLKRQRLHSDYSAKTWEFGKARENVGEVCGDCKFPYCFYATPRNWSMSSTSDVWNLMRCANVKCGKYFESCL